jgi:hypothetical protein
MATDREPELAAELLRTPPAEFVAARNARVAELKAAGERELAARIARLRRPRPAEWALNVVAHADPDVVDAWADVADSVRAAQQDATGGKTRTDLREMLTEWRARTADVVAAAPDGASTGELTALLTEIGGSADATAALRAGLVGAEPDTPTPTARPRRVPAGRPTAERERPSERPRASSSKAAERRHATDRTTLHEQREKEAADRAASRRTEAAARVQELAERVAEAEDQAAAAGEAVAAAEAALGAAEAAVADAERALDVAEQRRRAARHDRAEAERRQASAEERLERERRAHRAAAARLADTDG